MQRWRGMVVDDKERYIFGNCVTAALALPSASAITRNVFESKAMPVRRTSCTLASTCTPSLVLLEVGERGGDLLLGVGGEGLEIDHRLLGQRLLQIRHGGARGGAEQAEGGFRFHRQRHVGQAQDLVLRVEHRLAPDLHGGGGAEAEPALLLVRLDVERDQQPVAGGADIGP